MGRVEEITEEVIRAYQRLSELIRLVLIGSDWFRSTPIDADNLVYTRIAY